MGLLLKAQGAGDARALETPQLKVYELLLQKLCWAGKPSGLSHWPECFRPDERKPTSIM